MAVIGHEVWGKVALFDDGVELEEVVEDGNEESELVGEVSIEVCLCAHGRKEYQVSQTHLHDLHENFMDICFFASCTHRVFDLILRQK